MSAELILKNYYIISSGMLLLAIGMFIRHYEKKRPQTREIVTLAVLSALAVVSRSAFAMVPFFKPMMGIIMITAMAFGPGAGFLTGTVAAFVSNFIFGQGPWTPWQMFAYGIGGALAGILAKRKMMGEDKRLITAIIGYFIVQLIVGPILDTSSIFIMGNIVQTNYLLAIYTAGIIPNAVHGLATFLTLLLAAKPMLEKLNRIKIKYGMAGGQSYEV